MTPPPLVGSIFYVQIIFLRTKIFKILNYFAQAQTPLDTQSEIRTIIRAAQETRPDIRTSTALRSDQ